VQPGLRMIRRTIPAKKIKFGNRVKALNVNQALIFIFNLYLTYIYINGLLLYLNNYNIFY